jgi:uncharacterized membrane protein
MDAPAFAHVTFGFASLGLGVGVLSLPKGTDLHRLIGALYVFSMFGLNLTALLIYRVFGGFGAFHVLSLINLAILLAGFGVVLLQRPRKRWLRYHYYLMGWSYVGLLAATATEITVRVLDWSFVPAVTGPTILVTLGGGAVVQMLQQRTIRRLGPGRQFVVGNTQDKTTKQQGA